MKKNQSRTNHAQFGPTEAKDITNFNQEYHNLCTVFQEVFAWITEKVVAFSLVSYTSY
jgi:hypothetical protein